MVVENKNAATIKINEGRNPIYLHEHQIEAMDKLNVIDKEKTFNTLLVLPTGAGKTLTAARWLLKNAIDKGKKILWIAHRQLLLEQAADSFKKNYYSDVAMNVMSFNYRIISGMHNKPIHIKNEDNVIFASKDSITRNLEYIENWLKNEDVYLVIDEAHHATAKSYRRVIDFVKKKSANTKLLGLTATPFRTAENEKGLLKQIFTEDIVYSIDLETLIKKGILSIPESESCETNIIFDDKIGIKALKNIENLDIIPEDIADEIANNKERNRIIIKKYLDNYKKYGQTIIFALNRIHAITLKALFDEYGKIYGIKSAIIVSGMQNEFTGIDVSNKENKKNIEAYRDGQIQVLINVNILTEGSDLPKTQTVFLTRPTISTVLMTQMIGRALRGEKAGGTAKAYIVSFVDEWKNKIAWINPESLLNEGEFTDSTTNNKVKKFIRTISLSKIEEFVHLMDNTIDSNMLENLEFIKRVPLGMYVFGFIDENNQERNHQILVYDSVKESYEEVIELLPELFEEYDIKDDDIIEPEILEEICKNLEVSYFDNNMIPAYNKRDIEYLLKYYAQKENKPLFVPMEEIDRKKIDISKIADYIVKNDMRRSEQNEYINKIWEDEESLLKIYFNKKYFFTNQLEMEIQKLYGEFKVHESDIKYEEIDLSQLTLYEIKEKNPIYGKELIDAIYTKSLSKNGEYECSSCGKKSIYKSVFQIDHIVPMAKGGLSVSQNLQLLCRTCNLLKGDNVANDKI